MALSTAVIMLAIMTALTCALPGVFLVLRRQAMLAEAISHSALPGIVLAAIVVGNINSPLLIIGAGLMAMIVVAATEYLENTGLITGDAPQALVFPTLFSIGVILISTRFQKVHLHEDAVLVGDLNLVAILRIKKWGIDFGPSYFYVMLGVFVINAIIIMLLYKELKISTFDEQFAASIGLPVRKIHYLVMFVVSTSIVASFNAAGAVLVIAFLVVPAACAVLMVKRLGQMIFLSLAIAIFCAIGGFYTAYELDIATSPGMSVFYGGFFMVVYVGSMIHKTIVARKHKKQISKDMGL